MGKINKMTPQQPVGPVRHPAPAGRTEKAASARLQKLRETTNQFVVLGRGQAMLGAGKPANFSDTPPKGVSKTVERSVQGSLTPAKRSKQR
jgi:hypothetical protein